MKIKIINRTHQAQSFGYASQTRPLERSVVVNPGEALVLAEEFDTTNFNILAARHARYGFRELPDDPAQTGVFFQIVDETPAEAVA